MTKEKGEMKPIECSRCRTILAYIWVWETEEPVLYTIRCPACYKSDMINEELDRIRGRNLRIIETCRLKVVIRECESCGVEYGFETEQLKHNYDLPVRCPNCLSYGPSKQELIEEIA